MTNKSIEDIQVINLALSGNIYWDYVDVVGKGLEYRSVKYLSTSKQNIVESIKTIHGAIVSGEIRKRLDSREIEQRFALFLEKDNGGIVQMLTALSDFWEYEDSISRIRIMNALTKKAATDKGLIGSESEEKIKKANELSNLELKYQSERNENKELSNQLLKALSPENATLKFILENPHVHVNLKKRSGIKEKESLAEIDKGAIQQHNVVKEIKYYKSKYFWMTFVLSNFIAEYAASKGAGSSNFSDHIISKIINPTECLLGVFRNSPVTFLLAVAIYFMFRSPVKMIKNQLNKLRGKNIK